MNLSDQTEPTGIDLSKATLDDLARELKTRFTAVVIMGLCDDDGTGEEHTMTWRQGGRIVAIGMAESFKHDMLNRNED